MKQIPPALKKFAGFVTPEKNYFHMPNEWIDICAEIRDISELKVIQYVIRHTWGFHEYGICKTISTDEFMHGRRRQDGSRMDKGTGLSEQGVRNGIKQAIEHGYLVSEIDASDAGRIKKSYTLKMLSTQVQTIDPPQTIDPLNSIPQGSKVYTSGPQSFDLRGTEFVPRTEKDTIERHLKKDTIEKQRVASATARASSSSQENTPQDSEATQKRQAQVNTNLVTQPPAPKKPKLNEMLPPPKPVEPLAATTWGTRKCLAWFDYWRGGTLIAKYKLQQAASCAKGLAEQFDEATVIEIRGDMAADQYYIARGGPDVCDVANNIHKYINKKHAKPATSEYHVVSSFGTPGFKFEDEFYPSEAEKRAYAAAQEAKVSV